MIPDVVLERFEESKIRKIEKRLKRHYEIRLYHGDKYILKHCTLDRDNLSEHIEILHGALECYSIQQGDKLELRVYLIKNISLHDMTAFEERMLFVNAVSDRYLIKNLSKEEILTWSSKNDITEYKTCGI